MKKGVVDKSRAGRLDGRVLAKMFESHTESLPQAGLIIHKKRERD